jgi:hypothetical protein
MKSKRKQSRSKSKRKQSRSKSKRSNNKQSRSNNSSKTRRRKTLIGGVGWKFWKNITEEDKQRKMIDLINLLPPPTPDQVDASQYKVPREFKSEKFSKEFLEALKNEYFRGYKLGYADYHNCVVNDLFVYRDTVADTDTVWTKENSIMCEWKDHTREASEWRAQFFINTTNMHNANMHNANMNKYMQYFTSEQKQIWEARGEAGSKDLLRKEAVIGYDMYEEMEPKAVFYLYRDTLQDNETWDGERRGREGRTYLYKTIFKDPEQEKEFKEFNTIIDMIGKPVFEYDRYGNRIKTKETNFVEKYDALQKEQAKERVLQRAYERREMPPVPKVVETPRYELPTVPGYDLPTVPAYDLEEPPGYSEV